MLAASLMWLMMTNFFPHLIESGEIQAENKPILSETTSWTLGGSSRWCNSVLPCYFLTIPLMSLLIPRNALSLVAHTNTHVLIKASCFCRLMLDSQGDQEAHLQTRRGVPQGVQEPVQA